MKNQQVTTKVVADVICNSCGKSCRADFDKDGSLGAFEFANLQATWGYGSKSDGEKQSSHLCEKCYQKIIKRFKIPVDTMEEPLL